MAGYHQHHHLPDLLNELVLRQRRLEEFNLVALVSQNVLASLIDVLEQQNLDVLGIEGLQSLGSAASSKSTTPAGWWGVEGRNR